jgi:large subunit ribosomal protein L3
MTQLSRAFGRLQTKTGTGKKEKEVTRAKASGDEKFIKLSKKEDDTAKVQAETLERLKRIDLAKKHHISLDQVITPAMFKEVEDYIDMNKIDLVEKPLQTYEVLQEQMKGGVKEKEQKALETDRANQEKFEKMKITDWEGHYYRRLRTEREYMNVEKIVNQKFEVLPVTPSSKMSRRCGSMGYKMGMTATYNKWGHLIPLSVIQLDRCQVIRIKEKEKDGVDSILVGCGERNLKSMRKSEMGLFMKAGVPPKQDIGEFKISPENRLPIGFMLGVRHFTVGQFVDVKSNSRGKGFQGTMKRWNFDGLPASHGTSLTHRSGGSTGQRQDPGRVWKKLKMAGRMGNDPKIIRRLQVYRIDADRSLLYVKGSIAGPIGRHVEVFDSFFHWKDNWGLLNYPTFIYEKDKPYPSVIEVEPPQLDPTEDWLHENAVLPDDEEEIAAIGDIGIPEGPAK